MKKNCFLVFLFFYLSLSAKPTLCLNMIVKNEAKVIERCLKTVRPLIDYWVIVDTGSTDGTQKIIADFLDGIPGELHERPWVNFEHNRNEALRFAKTRGDYILFIDADEQLIYSNEFLKPILDRDFYYIVTDHGGSKYKRIQLVSSRLDWKWKGVLHEAVCCSEAKSSETLKGVENLYGFDGCRSKDPEKFRKDARILEEALKKEPDNIRYLFYLAQSYKDAGENERAIAAYQKRVEKGGWDQEVFWSLYQIALLEESMKKESETVVGSYYKAFHYRPTRAEPLYHLANYYRRKENYVMGYVFAEYALSLPYPDDSHFVETWIYEHGLAMELSICAYYLQKYGVSKIYSEALLLDPKLPQNVRACVKKNLEWINPKIRFFQMFPISEENQN